MKEIVLSKDLKEIVIFFKVRICENIKVSLLKELKEMVKLIINNFDFW